MMREVILILIVATIIIVTTETLSIMTYKKRLKKSVEELKMMEVKPKRNLKPEDWLTVTEARRYVRKYGKHWSRAYIYEIMGNGKLPFNKFGHIRIILMRDIDKFYSDEILTTRQENDK